MNFSPSIANIVEQAKIKKSNPRYVLERSLREIEKLEKFYKDKEYRDRLKSAGYALNYKTYIE